MKTGQSGTAVCRFSVAVTEKYNGNEQTEWFSLVAFGKTAEVAAKYLAKGSQVFIEGRIQTRKWQDNPELSAKLQRRIDQARVERNKEFKAEVQMLPELAKDETAMIMDTGRDNPALAGQFKNMEALGLLPEGTTARYEESKRQAYEARKWVTDPVNMGLSYPEQIAKAARELAPDPDKDAEGYRAKKAFQDMVVGELTRQQKLLNDDPAGFLAGQAAKVMEKEAALGLIDQENEAEAFKARADIIRKLASDAGMGLAGLEKIALSKSEIEQYNRTLNEARNPQERLTILSQLDQRFGDEAETAFNQMGVGFHEVLAAQAFATGDPRLARAAQMAVNRPQKMTMIKPDPLNLLVSEAVSGTDYGALLAGRASNSGGLDLESDRKLNGLKEFAAGMAASLIESGSSEKQARLEIKYALNAMFGGAKAINEDYASIYLTPDENGTVGDKESVLSGLNTLSQRFGDDFYWINDGDDHFVLASRVTGRQETFDGVRSVRVSRADAVYIGGGRVAPRTLRTDNILMPSSEPSNSISKRKDRAREVVERMRTVPPLDEHSLFIEAVRANTLKEMEALRPSITAPAKTDDENIFIDDPLMTVKARTGE